MLIPAVRAKCLGAELSDDLPSVWQGRPLRFQCGFFAADGTTSESDFTNVESFEFALSRDRSEGSEVAEATLLVAGMDDGNAIVLADWNNGTAQHITFVLSGLAMNIRLTDPDERFWWAVRAVLVTGELITLGAGYITLREDGGFGSGSDAEGTIVSVASGIAATTLGATNYHWIVISSVGTIDPATGQVSVTGGIATLVLDGDSISWVVTGSPGTAAAGLFILTVSNGIGYFTLGATTYSFPVIHFLPP